MTTTVAMCMCIWVILLLSVPCLTMTYIVYRLKYGYTPKNKDEE
jgi:hypothetical protein